jgi:hypothetical protein
MQMPYSPKQWPHVWVALGPERLLNVLLPLWVEHGHAGEAVMMAGNADDLVRAQQAIGNRLGEILIVEDPDQPSARPCLPSPFLTGIDGTDSAIGWLHMHEIELENYVRRAICLMKRQRHGSQPVVLLGPREQRYLTLLDELEESARLTPHVTTLRWSAERIRPTAMLAAVRLGAAAVLFAGHGSRDGWFAYGGIVGQNFLHNGTWSPEQMNGWMFSLSCQTGNVPWPATGSKNRHGFADAVVSHGVACAVLAPIFDTLHKNNRVLSQSLVKAMANNAGCLGDILRTAKLAGASLEGYTVIGDPGLQAVSAPDALTKGSKVFAPAAFENISVLCQ